MNKIRVIRAIKLLQSIPVTGSFNMDAWGIGNSRSAKLPPSLTEAKLRSDCGTAACALGWIASAAKARADGLKLVHTVGAAYEVQYCPPGRTGVYEGLAAAHEYFEFDAEDTAELLFFPDSYREVITPAIVASRMQLLLDRGEAAVEAAVMG